MEEFKITKERLKAMAEECPQAEEILKKGFPEAFKGEWEDITLQVKFIPDSRQGNGYYWIGMYEMGALDHFGYVDVSRGLGLCDGEKENYKIETGEAETGNTYFRILKRKK